MKNEVVFQFLMDELLYLLWYFYLSVSNKEHVFLYVSVSEEVWSSSETGFVHKGEETWSSIRSGLDKS